MHGGEARQASRRSPGFRTLRSDRHNGNPFPGRSGTPEDPRPGRVRVGLLRARGCPRRWNSRRARHPANPSADQRTDRNVGCPDRGRPRCAGCARSRSSRRRRLRLHAWHVGLHQRLGKEIVCADLRATHLLAAELSERFRAGGAAAHGWRYSDPVLLDAWGTHSTEPVAIWAERLFPALEGLPEALQAPTAQFLDVGTGVGHLAIAMCRQFPNLRVVGIDPFETALELARPSPAHRLASATPRSAAPSESAPG